MAGTHPLPLLERQGHTSVGEQPAHVAREVTDVAAAEAVWQHMHERGCHADNREPTPWQAEARLAVAPSTQLILLAAGEVGAQTHHN